MASKVGLNKDFAEGAAHNFSFEEWLSTSGLTALKDILLKHKMTSLQSLSTESTEFAAFISDPLLLPRAMLIPQAIQSMQQLQAKYAQLIDGADTEETVAEKHNSMDEDVKVIDDQQEGDQQQNNNNNNEYDSDIPLSPNPLPIDREEFKVSKPAIIKESKGSGKKTKRKMVQLKTGDHVKFVTDKTKQGIVRFIGEVSYRTVFNSFPLC